MKEEIQNEGGRPEATTSSDATAEKPRKARGFAAMD